MHDQTDLMRGNIPLFFFIPLCTSNIENNPFPFPQGVAISQIRKFIPAKKKKNQQKSRALVLLGVKMQMKWAIKVISYRYIAISS